jgi:hypothetical protein
VQICESKEKKRLIGFDYWLICIDCVKYALGPYLNAKAEVEFSRRKRTTMTSVKSFLKSKELFYKRKEEIRLVIREEGGKYYCVECGGRVRKRDLTRVFLPSHPPIQGGWLISICRRCADSSRKDKFLEFHLLRWQELVNFWKEEAKERKKKGRKGSQDEGGYDSVETGKIDWEKSLKF